MTNLSNSETTQSVCSDRFPIYSPISSKKSSISTIEKPFHFFTVDHSNPSHASSTADKSQSMYREAMAIAKKPLMPTIMSSIFIYMYAKSLNIFSLIITGTALKSNILGILGIPTMFQRFQSSKKSLFLPKLITFSLHIFVVLLIITSWYRMGVISKFDSDWAAWVSPVKIAQDFSLYSLFDGSTGTGNGVHHDFADDHTTYSHTTYSHTAEDILNYIN